MADQCLPNTILTSSLFNLRGMSYPDAEPVLQSIDYTSSEKNCEWYGCPTEQIKIKRNGEEQSLRAGDWINFQDRTFKIKSIYHVTFGVSQDITTRGFGGIEMELEGVGCLACGDETTKVNDCSLSRFSAVYSSTYYLQFGSNQGISDVTDNLYLAARGLGQCISKAN